MPPTKHILALLVAAASPCLYIAQSVNIKQDVLNLGVLNGWAIRLPQPDYPEEARAARLYGYVYVRVIVDENGNVAEAQIEIVSGSELFRPVALEAARKANFPPQNLQGKPAKFTGIIAYNFWLKEKYILPSGKQLGEVSIVKLHRPKDVPMLLLSYQTRFRLSDTRRLQAEVAEIWETFRYEVERNNLSYAVIWSGKVGQNKDGLPRVKKFLFVKSGNGNWNMTVEE